MPRPRHFRHIRFKPNITYFKPAGVMMNTLETIVLKFEEIEAIRLKDYLNLNQETAAEQMKISQPTFHRLLLNARKKIAESLTTGKAIKIEGGKFKLNDNLKSDDKNNETTCICEHCGFEVKLNNKDCSETLCNNCGRPLVFYKK